MLSGWQLLITPLTRSMTAVVKPLPAEHVEIAYEIEVKCQCLWGIVYFLGDFQCLAYSVCLLEAYPADEAASLEGLRYRQANAPDFFMCDTLHLDLVNVLC